MSRKEIANLVTLKNQLADRYISLSKSRKSKPARERLLRKADGYRREAQNFERRLKQMAS